MQCSKRSARDFRSEAGSHEERRAAIDLARGTDSKKSHRYLSLRVYWTQGTEEQSAVLCRGHRDKVYKQFPELTDRYEFYPADSCEQCSAAKRSADWVD
jgi:hypothetical protein